MEDKVSLDQYFLAYLNDGIQMSSRDGIFDTLTRLYGPTFFYDYLDKELAKSYRSLSELQLLRVKLYLKTQAASISEIENELIALSQDFKENFRREDVTARMGRYEFYTLFHGTPENLEKALVRFSESITMKHFLPYLSITPSKNGEEMLDFLYRSDEAEAKVLHT
jgi:GGDEF domain-containing protein